jgi:hypothetical protein
MVLHRRESEHHRDVLYVCGILPVLRQRCKHVAVDRGDVPTVGASETELLSRAAEAHVDHDEAARVIDRKRAWYLKLCRHLLIEEPSIGVACHTRVCCAFIISAVVVVECRSG